MVPHKDKFAFVLFLILILLILGGERVRREKILTLPVTWGGVRSNHRGSRPFLLISAYAPISRDLPRTYFVTGRGETPETPLQIQYRGDRDAGRTGRTFWRPLGFRDLPAPHPVDSGRRVRNGHS